MEVSGWRIRSDERSLKRRRKEGDPREGSVPKGERRNVWDGVSSHQCPALLRDQVRGGLKTDPCIWQMETTGEVNRICGWGQAGRGRNRMLRALHSYQPLTQDPSPDQD